MKGNEKIIEHLNMRLAEELTTTDRTITAATPMTNEANTIKPSPTGRRRRPPHDAGASRQCRMRVDLWSRVEDHREVNNMKKRRNMHMEVRTLGRTDATKVCYVWLMILAATLILFGGTAYSQESGSEQRSLGEISKELTNPVSNVWSMFTEFDLTFSNGDLNKGNSEVGGRMLFQPVLPFPLYGQGRDQWKLITRPTIPVLFSQPVPKGFDDFTNLAGLGDTQLPLLVSPPTGNWLLGLGPTWLLPTATQNEFGRQQWGVGPALVVGYKTNDWIGGVFPQYTWGIGGWNGNNKPDASYLSILYFFAYNLPDGWQIGTNPTINYDDKATSGNRWNVPVGLFVAKTIKIGNVPVKFLLGMEYSVVSQDAFGQVAQIKLDIIPVIPSLVQKAIFGGP